MSNHSTGVICEQCKSLLVRPNEPIRINRIFNNISHIEVRAEYFHSLAAKGCPICALGEHYVHSRTQEKYRLSRVRLTLLRSYDGDIFSDADPILPSEGFRHRTLYIGYHEQEDAGLLLIKLKPRANCSHGSCNRQDLVDRTRRNTAVSINVAPLDYNTRSQSRLATVRNWIDECSSNHPRCYPREKPRKNVVLRSRLIDVSTPSQPWLALRSRYVRQDLKYATLSHRWGVLPMSKLLRSNKKRMRCSIDVKTLPLVFVQAIDVCHYLGIKYFWIDALYLVQDNENDCAREIERMGDIYSHAFCNFSAMAAASNPVGLFVEGDALLTSGFHVRIEREDHCEDCLAFPQSATQSINDSDLMMRGWVLQERLLSKKNMFFGKQLSWECTELVANELFPNGVLSYGYSIPAWGVDTPFKLKTLLSQNPAPGLSNEVWYDLVTKYTACNLSFEHDVFPAISGLARRYNEVFRDKYLAGLWRKDLIRGLLWDASSPVLSSMRPQTYRAPSWSWAAVKTQVDFNQHRIDRPLAAIIEESITPAGCDEFGRIINGHITLLAHLRWRESRQKALEKGYRSFHEERYDDSSNTLHNGEHFLLLAYEEATMYFTATGPFCSPAMLHGLILRVVPDKKKTCQRIGTFQHPVGAGRSEEGRARYPEFADFDIENLAQEVVIII